MSSARPSAIALAVAAFLIGSQFYPDLFAISSRTAPFVVLVPRAAAWALFAVLVASGAYCAYRVARDPAGERSPVPLYALCAVMALCALVGFEPVRGFGALVLLALACAMHGATVRFYATPGLARVLFSSFLAVGSAAALLALGMQVYRAPAILAMVNNDRASGLFLTPNQFAAFLITLLTVGFCAVFAATNPSVRVLAWIAIVVGFLAMHATYSRGGWIGVATGTMIFGLLARSWRLAGLITVCSLAIAFSTFGNNGHHEGSDALTRVPALQAGVTTIALFPLTGVGPAAYESVHPAVRPAMAQDEAAFASLHPHNVILSLLTEEGVLGLAVVLYAAWRFVRGIRERLIGADRPRRLAAYAMVAGLAGTLGHGMVDLVGVAELTFVWVPFSAIALAVAAHGVPE